MNQCTAFFLLGLLFFLHHDIVFFRSFSFFLYQQSRNLVWRLPYIQVSQFLPFLASVGVLGWAK